MIEKGIDLTQSIQALQGIVRTLMMMRGQTEFIMETSDIRHVNNEYDLTIEHAKPVRLFSPEIVVKVTPVRGGDRDDV